MKLAAITIHARTRKEMSLVPANWEHVTRAAEMAKGTGTLIIGNGDVKDIVDAKAKAEATGADGIMLGRAIFGNPRLFAHDEKLSRLSLDDKVLIAEKLRVMIEHTKLFEELLGDIKNFAIMKKHYKAYVNGFDGAKELRIELMAADSVDQVTRIVEDWISKNIDTSTCVT
jgi:tRNA-dihydrouridine synthase